MAIRVWEFYPDSFVPSEGFPSATRGSNGADSDRQAETIAERYGSARRTLISRRGKARLSASPATDTMTVDRATRAQSRVPAGMTLWLVGTSFVRWAISAGWAWPHV